MSPDAVTEREINQRQFALEAMQLHGRLKPIDGMMLDFENDLR